MRNPFFKYFTLAVLAVISCAAVLLAQPLSQLEFDRGIPKKAPVAPKTTADQLKELMNKKNLTPEEEESLRDLRALIGDDVEPVATKDEATKPKALEIAKQTIEFEGDESFIPPQLIGPQADLNNKKAITSQENWIPQSKSCLEFSRPEDVCAYARALREVLARFSGEGNFYEGRCPSFCEAGEVAVVSNLLLTDDSNVELQNVATGRECRVSMKLQGPRWLLIKAKSLECSCVPQACAN